MRREVSERRLRRMRRDILRRKRRVNDGQSFFICGVELCGIKPQKRKQHGAVSASPRAVKLLNNDSPRLRGVNGCQSFFFEVQQSTACAAYKQSVILLHLAPAPAVPPRPRPRRAAPAPGNVAPIHAATSPRPPPKEHEKKPAKNGGTFRLTLCGFCHIIKFLLMQGYV